ncbi:MAG TPA: hypothetical protein VKB51_16670 [bacterium]|nr:hypothetical protein [bacterium]
MRSPITPVEPTPDSPRREGPAQGHRQRPRTFAEVLAEAEAVQDTVEISSRAAAPAGVLQSAAGFLARQAPWMGLPLLLRRPATHTDTPRHRNR